MTFARWGIPTLITVTFVLERNITEHLAGHAEVRHVCLFAQYMT